jgi:hypothetical protein
LTPEKAQVARGLPTGTHFRLVLAARIQHFPTMTKNEIQAAINDEGSFVI